MGAAYFYHLTRRPLEEVLAVLLEKARGAGWRVAVRARSEEMVARLDDILWLRPEDGFLPHGRADGESPDRQPILLTTGKGAENDAQCLVSVEGAEVTAEEVGRSARVMILFDGHDPGAVETARAQWRSLSGAGCAAQYWSEDSGSWEKRAETGGADG